MGKIQKGGNFAKSYDARITNVEKVKICLALESISVNISTI